MEIEDSDEQLNRLLCDDILRDGGQTSIQFLPLYSRKVKKLLGDRKLLSYLNSRPDLFCVSNLTIPSTAKVCLTDGHKLVAMTTLAKVSTSKSSNFRREDKGGKDTPLKTHEHICSFCQKGFQSRNKMFKHVYSAHQGLDRNNAAIEPRDEEIKESQGSETLASVETRSELKRALVLVLRKNMNGDFPITARWLVTQSSIKTKLQMFIHFLPPSVLSLLDRCEPFTPNWWLQALKATCDLCLQESSCFYLTHSPSNNKASTEKAVVTKSELSAISDQELNRIKVSLVSTAGGGVNDLSRDEEIAVHARALQVLQEECSVNGGRTRSLGVIGRDLRLQKLLRGNPLLPYLQKSEQLGVHQNKKGFWCVELKEDDKKQCGALAACSLAAGNVVLTDHHSVSTEDKAGSMGPPFDDASGAKGENGGEEEEDEGEGGGDDAPPRPVDPRILLRHGDVVFVDKPSGQRTEEVARLLRPLCRPGYAVAPASRLDQPTSGVLALPLGPSAEARLTALFRARRARKEYLALAAGRPPPRGRCAARLRHHGGGGGGGQRTRVRPDGKEALTEFEVVARFVRRRAAAAAAAAGEEGGAGAAGAAAPAAFALLRVWPRTGRTHQIRAHLAHLGFPLVGDRRYGDGAGRRRRRAAAAAAGPAVAAGGGGAAWWCPRLFLHAAALTLELPAEEVPAEEGGYGAGDGGNAGSRSGEDGGRRSDFPTSGMGGGLPAELRQGCHGCPDGIEVSGYCSICSKKSEVAAHSLSSSISDEESLLQRSAAGVIVGKIAADQKQPPMVSVTVRAELPDELQCVLDEELEKESENTL